MGTRYLLKCAMSPERVVEIQADVDALLEQFDAELSNWNPDSWVSRFNQSESVEWQDAPESVVRILEASKTVHALSGGAFDVTVSPLIELWALGVKITRDYPNQLRSRNSCKRLAWISSSWTSPACVSARHVRD